MFAEKQSVEEIGNWYRKQTMPTMPMRFSGVCNKLKLASKGKNDIVSKAINNMSFSDCDDLEDFKF